MRKLIWSVIGLMLPVFLNAATPAVANNQMKSKLEKAFPGLKVESIQQSEVPQLLQVKSDSDIVYVTNDGRYLFIGNILDLNKNKTNITELEKNKKRAELLKQIPESDMIVFKPQGKPKYVITVFTDIDCGYCRKFHNEIKDYLKEGIEVRYLPFPRSGANTPSYYKAEAVWCAKDRNAELTKAKNEDNYAVNKQNNCHTKIIDQSLALVHKLGLSGTPSILLPDGTLIPGYVPPTNLAQILKEKENA